MSDVTGSEPAHPRDETQLTVAEEAVRILLDQTLDNGELISSPWIGLHYSNERFWQRENGRVDVPPGRQRAPEP